MQIYENCFAAEQSAGIGVQGFLRQEAVYQKQTEEKNMDENERQRRARIRMAKRKRQVLIGRLIVAVLLVLLAALCIFVVKDLVGGKKNKVTPEGKATRSGIRTGRYRGGFGRE